jgi:hypothetical protein
MPPHYDGSTLLNSSDGATAVFLTRHRPVSGLPEGGLTEEAGMISFLYVGCS